LKQSIYFGPFRSKPWPNQDQLAPYFLTKEGIDELLSTGNDNWSIDLYGLYGTEGLPKYLARGTNIPGSQVDAELQMYFDPEFGVLLLYTKTGGGFEDCFCSAGDLTRLKEWIRTLQSDLMPVGLYIRFAQAWLAVKEFMDTNGELPKSIKWVDCNDLPPDTFPVPHADVPVTETHGYPWEKKPR
jgi:hypothetical protein